MSAGMTPGMTQWAPRRTWQAVTVETGPDGFAVTLDGCPARTPAGAVLALPARPLALAVAAEWEAAPPGRPADPRAMPLTRTANSALDAVAPARARIAGIVAGYGAADLLCYRAAAPEALTLRQARAWDPLLAWSARALGAPLVATLGVRPVDQPAPSLARLAARVGALDPFRLAALHDLVALSGSLVLGLAVLERRLGPDEAWALSRLDEDWQAAHWGRDAEAEAAAARRAADFALAARVLALLEATDG